MNASELLPQQIIDAKKLEYFTRNPLKLNDQAKEQETDEDGDTGHSYETPQIFIEQLFGLYSNGTIDDKSIKDQVNLMIFAGNDTSALTLAHAIVLLAMHPHVQEKAVEEVDRVYGDAAIDAPSTYEHVTKLAYVEQVIRETLRLYPVAPYLLRQCTADTQISECVVPRGSTVIVSLYSMHRDRDVWGPNANEFDPNHFHPTQMNKRSPNAFAPFSLGQRNCIGMRYAYISMKIILATLLRQFTFSTNLKMSDISTKFEITLKFVCGDIVKVERRFK